MSDPYVVLGVARTSSDEEIKSAYRELAKKYHPDNVAKSENPTVAEVFEEKMKEINSAYDTIVTDRKNGTDSTGGTGGGGSTGSTGGNYSSAYSQGASNTGGAGSPFGNMGGSGTGYSQPKTDFADVRQMINGKRYNEAEQLLDGVPVMRRNAEWYFLRGAVLYHRGWIEQAYEHLSQAVQLDPSNAEYRSAFNVAQQQRSGAKRGGYRYDTDSNDKGCDPFSICCGLLCADSCCECCGGDLISCC
ncbi:MAG: DnaJ domain-containing protein [Oscillospiraceae bacterium]|jgi:curved DNA-binding protein CbpA|nr:DnaJ domain-containing protein [Oscillospiraceae bacterium]